MTVKPRIILGLLTSGFVLVAILAGSMLWLAARQESGEARVRHTLTVQTELSQLLSIIQDAEIGQRGFLITGDTGYLAAYNEAVPLLERQFSTLARLIDDNPSQQRNTAALKALVGERLAILRDTIDYYRAGRRDEASEMVRSGSGKQLMDRIRDTVRGMQNIEGNLMLRRQVEAAQARMASEIGAIVLLAALLLLAATTLLYLRNRMQAILASNQSLAEANSRLVDEAAQRERLEGQLRQSQKMEAIGQLTGGLAHDFNNMLAVIVGSLGLIKRRLARGEHDNARYIDAALDGADRASRLTQRLLAFARQQPLAPEAIDANRFLAGISDLLRRALGERVRLETVLAGGLWRTHADPSQLETAVLNLAVNARDAMADGGRLTIETANAHLDDAYATAHAEVPAGQYVMIAVTDTGSGMPPEVVAKAFDPFFTTKDAGKGTGLGLSQVYGFVKQSGGHVKIYSEPAQGTTIKLYLPRFFGAEAPAEPEAARSPAPRGGGEVILVVEDEDRVRHATIESLRELGYIPLEASGAAPALRLIDARADIALLFTDVVMPDVNGRKLADEARRRRPGLRVLYTTGYTRNAIVHNGVLDPGVDLLSKPFAIDQLARKLREVLDRPARG